MLVKPEIKKFYDIYGDKNDLSYDSGVISSILTDLFKLNGDNVKLVSEEIIALNLTIGRRHKKLLMNYLNYGNPNDLTHFFDELEKDNDNMSSEDKENIINLINNLNINYHEEANLNFIRLWNKAEVEKDKIKLKEYLFGIFSRIHKYYNTDQMSLCELFQYNKKYIKGDLSLDSIDKLESFCLNNDSENTVHDFYDYYIQLLKLELQNKSLNGELEGVMNQKISDNKLILKPLISDRGNDLCLLPTEEFQSVYFSLNQDVFDTFSDLNSFYNYVLNYIKEIYRVLENNRVFAIEIDNIYHKGKNIKWDLYAYLGIFSERFIKTKEKSQFFKPEDLCWDMLNFYSIHVKNNFDEKTIKKHLKSYYKDKISIQKLYSLFDTDMKLNDFKLFINQWHYVYYGFTFNDCFILNNTADNYLNELNMIDTNHIFMIFYKYRIDNRKIPCPVCGGLNISGNSFPEVGHRSWECKNIICSKRSKSNRGKRYSFKTNYMQYNAANPTENNLIKKELISQWRKDIVSINTTSEIYEMFIKYFSFANEKILFINTDESSNEISKQYNRKSILISLLDDKGYVSKIDPIEIEDNLFDNYFDKGDYVNRFLVTKDFVLDKSFKKTMDSFLNSFKENAIIKGDSFLVLNHMDEKSIAYAVTSPPYYNAREYSQWPNLYLYLIDMYNIIKASEKVLKDSGVFLYNIGDINGNENTIVKSNMGNKRLLLGAYSILLFKKCGYELVDNIIWDKGEPQSKRSTNDGNFTPYYQKPVNAYEHMFVFKKKDKKLKINTGSIKWDKTIESFSPVIKINLKGENTLGHTAPYPLDIPDFISDKFVFDENDILLDPFSGSGTTIRSASNNNVKGLGVELSKEYVELTKEILEKENKIVEILYSE